MILAAIMRQKEYISRSVRKETTSERGEMTTRTVAAGNNKRANGKILAVDGLCERVFSLPFDLVSR